MLVRAITLVSVAVGGCAFNPASAVEPSGQAVAVVQSTAVEGAAGNRALQVDGPVFTGDLVKTDPAGQAQLMFRDGTRLVVGPGSELTIDSFVFADQSTAREFTINAVRGAFRFISGSSRKEAYSINTPTATIGVRGTALDLSVVDGATYLALFDGGVRFCDKSQPQQRCTDLTGRCRIIILAPNEDFRWIRNLSEQTELMDTVFRYAFRQSGLRSDFRVRSRGCAYRNLRGEDGHSDSERPDRGNDNGNDNDSGTID